MIGCCSSLLVAARRCQYIHEYEQEHNGYLYMQMTFEKSQTHVHTRVVQKSQIEFLVIILRAIFNVPQIEDGMQFRSAVAASVPAGEKNFYCIH